MGSFDSIKKLRHSNISNRRSYACDIWSSKHCKGLENYCNLATGGTNACFWWESPGKIAQVAVIVKNGWWFLSVNRSGSILQWITSKLSFLRPVLWAMPNPAAPSKIFWFRLQITIWNQANPLWKLVLSTRYGRLCCLPERLQGGLGTSYKTNVVQNNIVHPQILG